MRLYVVAATNPSGPSSSEQQKETPIKAISSQELHQGTLNRELHNESTMRSTPSLQYWVQS